MNQWIFSFIDRSETSLFQLIASVSESFREFARSNQLDCLHSQLLLSGCTLLLEWRWNAATDVEALNRNPVTHTILRIWHRSQFLVVNHIVADDVFLDLISQTGSDTFRISTWGDEDNATISILCLIDKIVEDDYTSVGHHHGHLERLQNALVTIDISLLSINHVSIAHLVEILNQIVTIVSVSLQSESRNTTSLRDGEHSIFVIGDLTWLKFESKVVPLESIAVRWAKIIPLVNVELSKLAKFHLSLVPGWKRSYFCFLLNLCWRIQTWRGHFRSNEQILSFDFSGVFMSCLKACTTDHRFLRL